MDGKKLLYFINQKTLTDEECVACLVNMEKVALDLKMPKLMFKGENGPSLAVLRIQKMVRGFLTRKRYKRIQKMILYVKVDA